ncbi:hypothetical protein K432DRAFT_299949 [Lepidopterella palustris CBS 459.81]|uniref:Uncharacterized protein n=1 Tax=Lepidopterella palustris CBS 459.81 TaxID=1314670 RepID=A0A8E2JEG4_9PEZI|nr:hypothetical protein K432DRAFT_299949 [Lepidopterella palustris CBS 459.81]
MDDFDDMDMDPEIAAAMGFSTFGNPTSYKKRKFNHNDAFVDGPDSDMRSGTGANSMKLGVRQKQLASNSNFDTSTGKQKPTSLSGLSQFLARGQASTGDGIFHNKQVTEQSINTAVNEPPTSSLPFVPVSNVTSASGGSNGGRDLHAFRKGVRNAQGDVAYFLPSFVEDPWRSLERKN